MGSLAGLLRRRGVRVTGSDEGVYPPMSTALADWGVEVTLGFRPENLGDPPPDLVVIGNAVRATNPEARAAIDAGIPHASFPDALYEHAIRGRHAVVVTGTHGKTTTVSLVATLLHEAGRDPSMLVGGLTANFDGSFRDGDGPEFVVEGDEYDTAFFDKTPKFHHYHPETLVITSVEFDHADIYRDLAHLAGEFEKLVSAMPEAGTIVAAALPGVEAVLADAPCRVLRYAVEDPADLRADDLQPDASGTDFALSFEGESLGRFRLPMYGRHNLMNALAAVGVLAARGVDVAEAARHLGAFRGVRRRQEVRGEAGGVVVLDDFAHHPTAIRETLQALRARYPGRRLVAVFEPRSNTSRRALFQRDFAEALAVADVAVVQQVADEPIYSATGEVGERLSAERLAEDLRAGGTEAAALADVDAIVAHLCDVCESGDVVTTLSNGSFGGIWDKLLAGLALRAG